ncbi:hypothetical protein [Sandaracinus amylolyticus]|uniref:hypothetical protein n=1 Tax=Sandaracinus amylolyticus TaxID=927083 RepID=UPI0012EEB7D9|nr:hypothetical protein [Sandaracinus amylolyticus]
MSPRSKVWSAALVAALCSLLARSAAHADDGAGAFRLALSTELFGFSHQSVRAPGAPDAHETGQIRVGLLTPRFALDVGVVIVPLVSVGLSVGLAYFDTSSGATTAQTFDWYATPWVELTLSSPDDAIRPYARAVIGTNGFYQTVHTRGSTTSGEATRVQLTTGATIGAHLFATDDFSLSPNVSVLHRVGDQSSGGIDPETLSIEHVEVLLGITIGAWLGGRASEPQAEGVDDTRADESPREDPSVQGAAAH